MNTYLDPARNIWPSLCTRPHIDTQQLSVTIDNVFDIVQKEGDIGLQKLTAQYDHYKSNDLRVSTQEIKKSTESIESDLKEAITIAYDNILKFHKSQDVTFEKIETTENVFCWQEYRAIDKVGLYIPGGTAPLFSTVLMLGIPAMIAGCSEIILTTPPDRNGNIHPAILYAAQLIGIKKIYKIGGAQAIAAMTIGTESISNVYKIFGPGNQYVTAAKQKAQKLGVSIDMPAGPSELLVLAGYNCVAPYVAADLLSQAEHGSDSQVICIVEDEALIADIKNELNNQIQNLPRKDIATAALENSKFIYFKHLQDRIDFINEYAPEHYIICSNDEESYVNGLKNAGSVFLGNYTPESAGDYASGTNHTLPTNGYAKAYSGVHLDSFRKKLTFQKISKEGIQNIGPAIETMAKAEKLDAHANAVSIRLHDINSSNNK